MPQDRRNLARHSEMTPKVGPVRDGFIVDLDDVVGSAAWNGRARRTCQLDDAGAVAADPELRRAVLQRVPFILSSPKCAASFCVTQLAMRFEQGIVPFGDGGFFNRMSKWFKK